MLKSRTVISVATALVALAQAEHPLPFDVEVQAADAYTRAEADNREALQEQ